MAKAPPKSLPNQASELPSTCKGFLELIRAFILKELPTKLLKFSSRDLKALDPRNILGL